MTYGVFSVLNNEPNSVLRHSVETEIDGASEISGGGLSMPGRQRVLI